MKKKLYIIIITLFCTISYSQDVIYSEDFTGQNGKGATGSNSGTTIDVTGVSWDVDVSSTSMGNNDWFRVQNEVFEGIDTDGDAIWFSPVIDISSFTNIEFMLDASETGNLNNSNTLVTEYKIDSGAWMIADTNGNLSNDFGSLVVSQTGGGLSGSSLQIRVTMNNNRNNRIHRIDNIQVTGCSSTPSNVIGALASVGASSGSADLEWLANICVDEILIIAKEGAAVTSSPTGDGSAYTANPIFGNGTEIITDEFVVYKGTGTDITITNLSIGFSHFEIFTKIGSTWSSGVPLSVEIEYCAVTGDTSFGAGIVLVDFGDISNPTGVSASGYEDFTAMSTDVELGEEVDLTVNINTGSGGAVTMYTYAWIDWNRDGDFEDADEEYDLGLVSNSTNGPTTNSPLTITIPTDATIGSTNLRVLTQYYNPNTEPIPTNGPCDGSDDGEVEDYTINIIEPIDYIYNNGWSPSDPNGVSSIVSTITVEVGDTSISTSTNSKSVLIQAGAGLTVNSGVTLTAVDGLCLESTSTSYSSLILDGTISGTVSYKRHINQSANTGATTGRNDLVSAPLTGQTFGAFRAANSNILSGTIGGVPSFLFGPFDSANRTYTNYNASDDGSTLDAGIGYRTGSTDNGTYTFTGTVETATITPTMYTSTDVEWNLVGNPYPSYLKALDFLNNTSNTAIMDSVDSFGIYGYDGTALNGWTVYNLANTDANTVLAPGQGFFIATGVGTSGDITFTPSMRTTGTADDFIVGRTSGALTYLKLEASTNTKNYSTAFYFNANASLGLDAGYDSVIWNNAIPSFALYSHLVQDNTGESMVIQSLNDTDLANTTIPLGVHANAGVQLIFSISDSNLPTGTEVYLEDTEDNTSTLLTTTDYIITPATNLNGTGRFFLKIENSTLSNTTTNSEELTLFNNPNSQTLVLKGLISEEASMRLYDIQGRLIRTKQLELNTNTQHIEFSNLNSGIYIAKIEGANISKSQKVVFK